ncbi:hypothetical protein [Paenibacillus lemnae]|nr:hypothetical protein [Paenibacillus lemnae]
MKNKHMGMKLMAGTLAAGLLLGGAGYLQEQVFAASSTDSASSSGNLGTSPTTDTGTGTSPGSGKLDGSFGKRGHGPGGFGGGQIFTHAAEILGLEESELMTELQAGKTLTEAAQEKGVTRASLLERLTAAMTQDLNQRLDDGTLTEEQAAAQKEKWSEHLEDMVDQSGFKPGGIGQGRGEGPGHRFGDGAGHGPGRFGSLEDAADILGMSESELQAGMREGKSLAELAEAKGISESQLIQKLKDSMTEPLKEWVNEKRTAPDAQSGAEASDSETDAT